MKESDLQEEINADLRRLRIGFWHREKGGRNKQRSHNKWKFDPKDNDEPKKTWPDLLIFPGKGEAFFVEVKKPGGTESDEQIAFGQWAKSMGYDYIVIYSMEEWKLLKHTRGIE